MRSSFSSPVKPSVIRPPGRARAMRLALALLASVAAHLALLWAVAMPELGDEPSAERVPLSARIVSIELPAPAPAPAARKPAPAKPAVKRVAAAKPSPPRPESPPAADALPPAPEAPKAVAKDMDEAPKQVAEAPPSPPPAPEAAPAIPFPARIYLEYDLSRGVDQAPIGRVVHRFERDGTRYLIQSETKATGIAVLFVTGRYVQESRGTLSATGLQPEHFTVRRGRAERTESADFDWPSARATIVADGSSRGWTLRAGAQDQLSMLHQMSLLLGAPPASILVTNGRRFFDMSVEILGNDPVETGMGMVRAVRVRGQREGEFSMDVWFAPDYGNLPVKVRMRDRRGEEMEQVLAEMKVSE